MKSRETKQYHAGVNSHDNIALYDTVTLWQVQQELQTAKKRVSRLKTEIQSRGYKPDLTKSSSCVIVTRWGRDIY